MESGPPDSFFFLISYFCIQKSVRVELRAFDFDECVWFSFSPAHFFNGDQADEGVADYPLVIFHPVTPICEVEKDICIKTVCHPFTTHYIYIQYYFFLYIHLLFS